MCKFRRIILLAGLVCMPLLSFAEDVVLPTPADIGLSVTNLGVLVSGVIGLCVAVWGAFYAWSAIQAKLARAKKA